MYLPGCPPRPEMLIDAILKLHAKIMDEPLGPKRARSSWPASGPSWSRRRSKYGKLRHRRDVPRSAGESTDDAARSAPGQRARGPARRTQRRPTPGERRSAGPWSRHGMFGVHGSGDTSGFGGLVRRPWTPAPAERPYGGYFDEVADALRGGATRRRRRRGAQTIVIDRGEITCTCPRAPGRRFAAALRDDPALRFELCVVDLRRRLPRRRPAPAALGLPAHLDDVPAADPAGGLGAGGRPARAVARPRSTRPPTGRSGRPGTCSGSSTTGTPR